MSEMPLRIDWRGCTDRGSVREVNEDNFAALPEFGLWAVADGMGGHARGDWASARIVESLKHVPNSGAFEPLMRSCSDAIHAANAQIFQEAEAQSSRMGSTVVGLVIAQRRFGIVWAGDSRAYLLRNHHLYQLTRDHTQVQALVDAGNLTPEEARHHPFAHVLAKAVGVEEVLELEAVADDVLADDVFLLCSDGLYGTLSDAEITDVLVQAHPLHSAQQLIDRCLEVGAKDNVTVVVVQVQEPTQIVFASGTAETQSGDES